MDPLNRRAPLFSLSSSNEERVVGRGEHERAGAESRREIGLHGLVLKRDLP
jgi:hypothetical protein